MILPEHMSVAARNQRLYDTLKGMGLFCEIVLREDDPDAIDSIVVACAMSTVTLQTEKMFRESAVSEARAEGRVGPPMKGDEVPDDVAPAEDGSPNVVNFPSKS